MNQGGDWDVDDPWLQIHYAVTHNHNVDVISTLLHWSPETVVSETGEGLCPLHLASASGAPDIMALLLDWGDDMSQLDNGHKTALHVAAQSGRVDSIRLLLSRAACAHREDVCVDALQRTMLHRVRSLTIFGG